MSKQRKSSPKALVIGRKPVREALELRDPPIEKIWLHRRAGGPEIEQIRRLAATQSIPLQYVPEARFNRLGAEGNHQGVVAAVAPVALWDVDELLQSIAPTRDAVMEKKPMLLVLDRIEDPQNFGAILRSALAAGVQGVIVPGKQMAPLNEAAVKASAGTALRIPIARVARLPETLYQLKERGYWIIGTEARSEDTIHACNWDRPVAVVMGSERSGMHPQVRAQCDTLVSIPMYGPVDSLNVSVATAIVLFTAAAQRTG